jgi:2-oxoglutarate ferredoxin oxidoreductase subunit beta
MAIKTSEKLEINHKITWCPGCPNNGILDAVKLAITKLMKQGYKREDFAMTTGIGCHGKIFDYINISGFYGLHGRTIPTAMGIKLGNPNLHVLSFAGDGDAYAEGISHFIHAGRYNSDISLFVHDNQSFSLTTGQATPTSQEGYKTKAEPLGKLGPPLNPLKLALTTGATFVARTNARDVKHAAKIIEKAIKHKGFSFVEIIQDCIVFNLDVNNRDKQMHKFPNKKRTLSEALKLAETYDYNLGKHRIPIGIFYEEKRKSFEEAWPQLTLLKKKKIGWKNLKR